MKKYIVLTLLFSLVGMNISVQAAARGGGKKRTASKSGGKQKRFVKQCSICIEGQTSENPLQALTCGHEFHATCLGGYIKSAFLSRDTNFDELKCPNFSLGCADVLTREEIDDFTSSSSSSSAGAPGNAAILAFFDQRADERANPPVINSALPDAAELAELIAAGQLQICPGCRIPTERTEGCNHMTCSTNKGGCGVHYCYVCATPYNPLINNGIDWEARACNCPHFPGGQPEPIPVPDGQGGALQQANPMALINAADRGNLAVVNALIGAGAAVNIQDANGNTALHSAVREGHLAVVNALIAAPGIQVNTQNARDWTPFDVAAHYGNIRVVNALIAAGADVSTQDTDGWTALHRAAREGRLRVVNALIAAGADVSTPDTDGRTALHRAAREGRLRVVQALIAAGADVSTPDANGQTASQLAARNGHLAVVAALR